MTETTEQAAARIAGRIWHDYIGAGGLTVPEVARAVLTRELPALAGRVVTLDGEALFDAVNKYTHVIGIQEWSQRDDHCHWARAAETLRARAGAAPVATTPATAWVYPAEVAGELVVPSFGYYFTRTTTDGWSVNALTYHTGEMLTDAVTAIRGWDRTTGESGPIIERTTRREWTAETVPQSGPYIALKPYDSREMSWQAWDDKTECARVWNDLGVLRWCPVILPATGGDDAK